MELGLKGYKTQENVHKFQAELTWYRTSLSLIFFTTF